MPSSVSGYHYLMLCLTVGTFLALAVSLCDDGIFPCIMGPEASSSLFFFVLFPFSPFKHFTETVFKGAPQREKSLKGVLR